MNISQLEDTLFMKLKGNCFLSFLTISAKVGSGSMILWILLFIVSEREMAPFSLLNPLNGSSSMILEDDGGGEGG